MEVDQKRKSYQEECHLVPEIQTNLNETVSPIEIFSLVTGLRELPELIVEQSNLYADQNGRNFTVIKEKLANLQVVPSDSQSKKKEKNKKELWKWTKNVKVTKQEECHLVLEIQHNLNETVSPIEIFSLVIDLELIVEQSNLYVHQNGRNFRYQGRTESISWNKLCHGNQ